MSPKLAPPRPRRARTWSPTPFEQKLAERMIDMAEAWRKRMAALETRVAALEADLAAERTP